jgi:hypothetical protein
MADILPFRFKIKPIPKLHTPEEAILAIQNDKLATVYYRADVVFVATAFGTGTFSYDDWRAANAPKNSLEKK